ncbi:hypothetical protein GNP80_10630 [Aliivibrio fischeri]|uniref:hypothetical protein n=1 Tax=Aliivibrio fischeri TaxID=668 RepID=UPI0012D872D3|nr:hypothetical protein [Aliivibrio fischeri]MUK92898.1 hypothetical protein [Aliivibrio fischeri]
MVIRILWFCYLGILVGCSSHVPKKDRDDVRNKINTTSSEIITKISKDYPDVADQLQSAKGYGTVSLSGIMVPAIGGATGRGAIYNNEDSSITYIDVNRYDLGIGLALGNYEALAIFDTEEAIAEYKRGVHTLSLEAALNLDDEGTTTSAALLDAENDVPVYVLSNSGFGATGTLRYLSTSVNHDLNDTGLGDFTIPNKTEPTEADSHSLESTKAPKKWERSFPFYAQAVIDKGYSLPKPYGISIIYTDTFQYMDISDLDVGINGSKQYPIDFVSFDNNSNNTKSPQLKLDAWLFPFMNVFGAVGKIKGTADIGIQFSGDDLLNQLGKDCSLIKNKPICKIFQGRDPSVSVTAHLEGTNYTLGTVLASGWNSYFVTLPISVTYADMKKNDAEGLIVNISPRVGKIFPITGPQSIAVYAGGTYLDSTLTLTGTYNYEGVGIDYKVKQSNTDKWASLVGANYVFNQNWSLAMEYGWKSDRKRQFITLLNRRF